MAKGFFTQGIVLLTSSQTAIEDVKAALKPSGFQVVKEMPAQKEWATGGGPSVVVPFRPEVNGYAAIDVVNEPWPDSMGDPKAAPTLFAAWSMGNLGPFTFPNGLLRASQQSWLWQEGETISQRHRGFIRIRLSYVFGANREAPVWPKDCNPIEELQFLSRVAMALMNAPGVICYFNPNGEVLCDRENFVRIWGGCEVQQKLPLLLWTNVRLFSLNAQFGVMDIVGNGQFDVQDVSAIFPEARYTHNEIAYYLRNVTHYLLDLGREIESGESIDGPGETELSWIVQSLEADVLPPPRRILRLCPRVDHEEIQAAVGAFKSKF